MIRYVLAAAPRGAVGMAALFGASATSSAAEPVVFPNQVLTALLQQSIGAPGMALTLKGRNIDD